MLENIPSDNKVELGFDWWFGCIRFVVIHLLCLLAFWVGFDVWDVMIAAAFYVMHLFFVTAGYHRYFSHRTYKMGRVMQFIMAWGAEQTAQKGVLWWASHHRHHHKYSDEPNDVHSVRQGGFFWAHVGWIFHPDWEQTEMSRVKDWAKYPELVWLDKNKFVPPLTLALICFLIGGWTGIIVWFLWSVVIAWHGTFTINSLSHVFGSQRYETGDDSRNNWFLALITLGEGWHNNHHHFQASVKQGFFWWEYDFTYYALWALSKLGLVSGLRKPPAHVVNDSKHPVQQAIAAFAESATRVKLEATQSLEELYARQNQAYEEAVERWEAAKRNAQESANRRIEIAAMNVEEAMIALEKSLDDLKQSWDESAEEILAAARESLDDIHASLDEAQKNARRVVDGVQKSATETMDELQTKANTMAIEVRESWLPEELSAHPSH